MPKAPTRHPGAWVPLYRRMFDDPRFTRETDRGLSVLLIARASHREELVHEASRGPVTSRASEVLVTGMSLAAGWPRGELAEKQARRALRRLARMGRVQLELHGSGLAPLGTAVAVVKYREYQQLDDFGPDVMAPKWLQKESGNQDSQKATLSERGTALVSVGTDSIPGETGGPLARQMLFRNGGRLCAI